MGEQRLHCVHPELGRIYNEPRNGGSSFAVVAMSVLTFRGVRYEQASSPSGSEAPVQKLVYRSPAQEKRAIRSARTAALLQLEDPTADTRLVYRGVPVRSL